MGRQINFYLHTDDLKSFYEVLGQKKAVFCRHNMNENRLIIVDPLIDGENSRLILLRNEDFTHVKFRKSNECWYIDNSSSVVELDRSRYLEEEGIIVRGRLYFQSDYYECSELIKKNEDFVKWANSLLNTLRRKLEKRTEIRGFISTFYLGRNANKWIDANNVKVDSGGSRLIISK